MPGWHKATEELQKRGKLQMVGIIQEQHPDRCQLFMQWKKMGWPVLVDSLNLTGIAVVPVTYAIDEHGIVRLVNPSPEKIEEFINRNYERPMGLPQQPDRPGDLNQLKAGTSAGTASAWRAYGDALFLWGGKARSNEAMEAYQKALRIDANDSLSHFRLGVSYRRRYDSEDLRPEDFRKAVEHWTQALELNPNQYIWRRRIQQYGPRLTKPYPFYDWIEEARQEIQARGERPVLLLIEPGGAEIAKPSKEFPSTLSEHKEPDPGGKIMRDHQWFIEVEATVVPPIIKAEETARVHIVLRPNVKIKAHWNNEAEPLRLWISPREGWKVDSQYLTLSNPPQAVSAETREVQFEIASPEKASPGDFTIPAYALYYVCEDVNGTCLYRRQDININVKVKQ